MSEKIQGWCLLLITLCVVLAFLGELNQPPKMEEFGSGGFFGGAAAYSENFVETESPIEVKAEVSDSLPVGLVCRWELEDFSSDVFDTLVFAGASNGCKATFVAEHIGKAKVRLTVYDFWGFPFISASRSAEMEIEIVPTP